MKRLITATAALILPLVAYTANANWISDHANQCDAEIGFSVPQIDCEDGTIVPTTLNGVDVTINRDPVTGTFQQPSACDKPNILNHECDPGSKFQVVLNNPEAYIVAHCRQRGGAPKAYADIAVIQHNKTTGATCFYQNSGAYRSRLTTPSHIITAPSTGSTISPGATTCFNCHDNGPLIRSLYITQIKSGPNVIPGNGQRFANRTQPYFLVGHEHFERYHITVPRLDEESTPEYNKSCTSCHALSAWRRFNSDGLSVNSAGRLAADATSRTLPSKNSAINIFSPMWMSLAGPSFFQYEDMTPEEFEQIANDSKDSAKAYEACASSFTLTDRVDNENCTITPAPGRRIVPSSLVNGYGKCLDQDSSDFNAGIANARVQAHNCYADNRNQRWTYDPAKQTIVSGNGKCLNVGTEVANGMLVNATTCDGSDRQKWTYNAYTGQVKNISVNTATATDTPKCLDLDQATANLNGGKVQMWDCFDGTWGQRWALQDVRYKFLVNKADPSKAINNEDGLLKASKALSSWWSAQWTLERFENFYRIRNKWKSDEYLNIETGTLKSTNIDIGWHSAMWVLRNRPEYGHDVYTIQNRWQSNQYITFKDGVLKVSEYDPNTNDPAVYWTFKNLP